MKKKWKIVYSAEFEVVVEAENFEEIQEWFLMETPEQIAKIEEIKKNAILLEGNEAVHAGDIIEELDNNEIV